MTWFWGRWKIPALSKPRSSSQVRAPAPVITVRQPDILRALRNPITFDIQFRPAPGRHDQPIESRPSMAAAPSRTRDDPTIDCHNNDRRRLFLDGAQTVTKTVFARAPEGRLINQKLFQWKRLSGGSLTNMQVFEG